MRSFRGMALVASAGVLALWAVCVAAAAVTQQMTTPFEMEVTNPCNGDIVTVEGKSHTFFLTNGHKVEIHENWADVTGVAVDGTLYQASDVSRVYVVPLTEGGFTFGSRESFELISKDASSNFLFHMTFEITFNPPADPVMTMHGRGAECSGPTPAPA